MFERLQYVGRASPNPTPRDVHDITRNAHNRNSRFALTGGLLHLDGQFVQLLEGEAFRLRDRFAIIAADPRHSDVQVRYSASASERLFRTTVSGRLDGLAPARRNRPASAHCVGL